MKDRKPDKAKVSVPTDRGCHTSERHFRGQDINSSVDKAVKGRWGGSENTEKENNNAFDWAALRYCRRVP